MQFIKCFENYLTDRYQYVVYNGVQSNAVPMTCGAPHGPILGPLLFIIYTNDICNVSHLCTLFYADDTSVLENDTNVDK